MSKGMVGRMASSIAASPLPLVVNEIGNRLPTSRKVLGSTPVCDLWVRALLRCGYDAQSSAGLLGVRPSQFSKDFSPNWPNEAPMLKRLDSLSLDIKQEYYALGAADCGLQVGIDWEDRNILLRFAQLLRSVDGK